MIHGIFQKKISNQNFFEYQILPNFTEMFLIRMQITLNLPLILRFSQLFQYLPEKSGPLASNLIWVSRLTVLPGDRGCYSKTSFIKKHTWSYFPIFVISEFPEKTISIPHQKHTNIQFQM